MPTKQSIIDTDIHPVVDRSAVLARLPEPWRTRYASGNSGPGNLGYWNPNGVMRPDAVTPDGSRIEKSPHTLGRYFLDEYGIEYAVLNPGGTLALGLSPEPDYAAALISAANDVFIEEWLPVDSRLRYSVVVSPADALTSGTGGRSTARHAQWSWRPSSADPARASGQAGPASIHSRRILISSAVSGGESLSSGGMRWSGSSLLTYLMSGLSAELWGTIARSPLSPPLSATSRTSSRKPLV